MDMKPKIAETLTPLTPIATAMQPGGRLRHEAQAILFDIYGTLFISDSGDIGTSRRKRPRTQQLQKLILRHKIKKTPQMLLSELYRTIETQHQALRTRGIPFPEIEIDKIWMQVLNCSDRDLVRAFAVEFEFITNPVYPMPQLIELLAICRSRRLHMGIISNAQFFSLRLFNWLLDAEVKDFGFDPDLCFLSYRFRQAKPATILFRSAAETLQKRGVRPGAVLYVGNDMLNDIYPAQKIGFQTALFAGDHRSLRLRTDDERCRDLKPDIVITELIQIKDHL